MTDPDNLPVEEIQRLRCISTLRRRLLDIFGDPLGIWMPEYFTQLYSSRFRCLPLKLFRFRGHWYHGRRFHRYSRECVGIRDANSDMGIEIVVNLTRGSRTGCWLLTWGDDGLVISRDGNPYKPSDLTDDDFIIRLTHAIRRRKRH
jgi:hypothetical protein